MISELSYAPAQLYEWLTQIQESKGKDQVNPEDLLSFTYLLTKYPDLMTPDANNKNKNKPFGLIMNSKKSQITLIVDKLSSAIEDELLYPKAYVENVRQVIQTVEKLSSDGNHSGENASQGLIP
jgi:hypothetical protein